MPQHPLRLVLLGLLIWGCGDKSEDDDDDDRDTSDARGDTGEDPTLPGEDTGEDTGEGASDCGGTAPVVTKFSCEDGGTQPHYETGEPTPTIAFTVQATDADGDLNQVSVALTVDDTVDGTIGSDALELGTVTTSVSSDPCGAEALELQIMVFVEDAQLPYGSTLEWSASVTDNGGERSAPVFASCRTPDAPDA